MTIFKSKRDNKTYILSNSSPMKYTGSWLEFAEYDFVSKRITSTWKKLPKYKENDFYGVCII